MGVHLSPNDEVSIIKPESDFGEISELGDYPSVDSDTAWLFNEHLGSDSAGPSNVQVFKPVVLVRFRVFGNADFR